MSRHASLPDLRAAQRLAIIKLSAIGDVVHALPVASALGRAYPHLEITWIVEALAAPLLSGNPHLRQTVVLPSDWRKPTVAALRQFATIRHDLRERRFDVALDLQGLTKSAAIAWATGAPFRLGYDWLRELAPIVERRIPRRATSVHIVDQLLDTAHALGAPADSVEFPLPQSLALDVRAIALLAAVGVDGDRPFLVLNPTGGGQGGYKLWGAERLGALIDALSVDPGYSIVLVGGTNDASIAASLSSRVRRRPATLIGKTTLEELVAVIRRSRAHVSGDTGSAHIAAALGVPAVCVFGRTDPARLAPYGQQDNVVQRRDQCASACWRAHARSPINSSQKCRTPPPRCLESVGVEDVARRVQQVACGGSRSNAAFALRDGPGP